MPPPPDTPLPTTSPTSSPTYSPTLYPTAVGQDAGDECTHKADCKPGLTCASYKSCVDRIPCHALCRRTKRAVCRKPTAQPGCVCRLIHGLLCADVV